MFREKSVSFKLILPILMILLLSIAGCGGRPINPWDASKGSTSQAPSTSEEAKPNSSTATKAGVVTYENYLNIKFDTTYDDVKSILGEGTKTQPSANVAIYKWDEHGKTISIRTNKGIIGSKSQANLGKTTANLTEDQFNKITEGMAIDQVVSILGPDYREISSKKSANSVTRSIVWMMPDSKNIKVKLKDDKVTKAYNYLK